jgi:hypothetical protein
MEEPRVLESAALLLEQHRDALVTGDRDKDLMGCC